MPKKEFDKEYFESILDNLSGGLISIDCDSKVAYVNPMAYRILHMDEKNSLVGQDYEKAFADFDALKKVIDETIETGKTKRRAEIQVMHANTPIIIGYSTIMVKNKKNENLGIAVIFQDISFVARSDKSRK